MEHLQRRNLTLAIELSRLDTLGAVLDLVLPHLAWLFDANVAVFATTGPNAGLVVYPPDETYLSGLRSHVAAIWDGPLTRWSTSMDATEAVTRVSDLRPLSLWRTSPFYPVATDQLGARYLLCLRVSRPGDGSSATYLVGRDQHEFEREDLDRAETLLPVLVSVHARFASQLDRRRDRPGRITVRQRQVLELMAQGMTAQAISSRLEISLATTRKHLENAYERLGVHDRVSAVALLRDFSAAAEDWSDSPIRQTVRRLGLG